MARRAFFDVAPLDVELTLNRTAIVARHIVSMPVKRLVPITNTRHPHNGGCALLFALQLLGPEAGNLCATELDEVTLPGQFR